MRYHQFRSSSNKYLLIADSRIRKLGFPNVNILTLPGVQVIHVDRFIPSKGKYELTALFIGGNDLYDGYLPSRSSVEEVADRITQFAERLFGVTDNVFVLAVSPRFPTEKDIKDLHLTEEQLQRHTRVNKIFSERSQNARWGYSGISLYIYCEEDISSNDHIHLTPKALSGVESMLKNRVLYKKRYSPDLAKGSHLAFYECHTNQECKCKSYQG